MDPSTTIDVLPLQPAGLVVRVGPCERLLDHSELADLIHEAFEHAQRERGVIAPHTGWHDAAAAADLLLWHIARTV